MAQNQKQLLKYGDRSFEERDFYGASLYYKKALLTDSTDLTIMYKYVESLRLYNEYELAEQYYQKVYNKDRGKNFKEALFWLASMQKYNAKYQQARKNFEKFVFIYKDKDTFFYKKAKQEIGSCEYAQQLMQDTLPLTVNNLGPSVNTVNAEFSPFIYNDTSIYFSSLRSNKITETNEVNDPAYSIRIYTAVKKDTTWVVNKEVDEAINYPKFHNGNGAFNSKKDKFYFSRCDNNLKCKVFVSDFINGSFKPPLALAGPVNEGEGTSTQPFLVTISGKEYLFFSSDRPGGFGSMDIWYSIYEENGFTKIYNAGKSVNSLDEELSPFYSIADTSLYFSSGWHFGLGGYDIFKSKGSPEKLSTPVNLGYPINTSTNDFYYQYSPVMRSSFLTSNRKGSITAKGETCCNDLWVFSDLKKPKDSVPILTFSKYIPVTLYFHNDEPGARTMDTTTSLNYRATYDSYISLKKEYKKEYAENSNKDKRYKAEQEIEIFFKNYLEAGAANLEAFTEQLKQILEKGQKLEITVKGFASPLAKTGYNVNLTLRRIASMENYMKQYKNGVLLPYFQGTATNGGSLKITKIPFGEYKALKHVNDNYHEVGQSVYSPSAALERKIEIVSVTVAKEDSLKPQIKFLREIYNFGTVNARDTLKHRFNFKNTGNISFVLHSITDSCSCLLYSFSQGKIEPGKSGFIEVSYSTAGLRGKQVQHFYVKIEDLVKELTLTADIE